MMQNKFINVKMQLKLKIILSYIMLKKLNIRMRVFFFY